MEGNQDLDKPPLRGRRTSLSGVLGLVTSGLWLIAAAAGFVGFVVWYFYTLEERAQPAEPIVLVPEQRSQALHDTAPNTDILLQNLNTRSGKNFKVIFFGHPFVHCAVRVNPFQERDAFVILFVRRGENFSLSFPKRKYQGVIACGSLWDEQDFSFVGVEPRTYPDTDFFEAVQSGRDTGVDLGRLWEAGL